jgi:hypothetical protein
MLNPPFIAVRSNTGERLQDQRRCATEPELSTSHRPAARHWLGYGRGGLLRWRKID